MRTKIVGAGNTMDSYGDKYLAAPSKSKSKEEAENKPNLDAPQIEQFKQVPKDFNKMGSYDSYSKGKSELFQNKVADIVEGVQKKEEELRKNGKTGNKAETYDDFDFLGLEECEIDSTGKGKEMQKSNVDFLNDSK